MSPLFSLDSVYPVINRSGDRLAVLRAAVITASSGTLQQQGYMSAASCHPALQHWEKHLCFLLLQDLLMDAKDPALILMHKSQRQKSLTLKEKKLFAYPK